MCNVAKIMLVAASCLMAQTSPQFEVASLKPGQATPPGGQFNINLGTIQHGALTLTNTSLADCLRFAYKLSNNEQIAGPEWIKDKLARFDVVAKAPADTPDAQMRLMLQNLLAERFQMVAHHEQRPLSYLALELGKRGPKLQEAKEDADGSANSYTIGRIVSSRISMATLVTLLSRFLREPVLDLTGLPGAYQVKLQWTSDSPAASAAAPDPPPIFEAMETQLGLRLESKKGPLEVLVVDHAEKVPVGN